jgi:hypothetical protein
MDELSRLPLSFLLGSAEVHIVKMNPMTLKGKIDPLKKTRFQAILAQIESRMMLDGNPAQKGIPIEMPPQRTGRSQHGGHTQSLADPLLLPKTSRAYSDYFLQGHDIRVQPY